MALEKFLVKTSEKYEWINLINEYFNDGSAIVHLLDNDDVQDEHRARNLDIFMNMEKNQLWIYFKK